MIADKLVKKLNQRENKFQFQLDNGKISGTKYVISGGFIQGLLEGLVDGCLIVGAITITAQLGSMIYEGF